MQQQEATGTEIFNQAIEAPKEEAPQEQTKPDVKDSAPIYLGGKKFNSVEELAQYTSNLEKERYATQVVNHVAAPVTGQAEKPLSELIFEDPERALAIHERKVIEKLKAEETQKANEQRFWNDFYKENKDLSDDTEMVQFVMNKHWGEISQMHPEQASKKIAEYTRKTILRYKGDVGIRTEMPTGQAKAGPSGTRSAPAVTESRPAPVDFVSQLKKIQSGRK